MLHTSKINAATSWKLPYLPVPLTHWWPDAATVGKCMLRFPGRPSVTVGDSSCCPLGPPPMGFEARPHTCCSQSPTKHGNLIYKSITVRYGTSLPRDCGTPRARPKLAWISVPPETRPTWPLPRFQTSPEGLKCFPTFSFSSSLTFINIFPNKSLTQWITSWYLLLREPKTLLIMKDTAFPSG